MGKKAFTLIGFSLLAAMIAVMVYVMRDGHDTASPAPNTSEDTPRSARILAESLQVPWRTATLPSGDLLVTERPGRLRQIGQSDKTIQVPDITSIGEGGLLGIALHPRFTDNRFVYLYHTTKVGDGIINKVIRYVYRDQILQSPDTVIEGIPGASYHDGGEIAFGPDDYLYIGTGDAGRPDSAQDVNSLAGKILRITDDGSIPAENPYDNHVYSLGFRNVQGLAWDAYDQLWATDHGPSGAESGFDELNRVEMGANYGWPLIRGSERQEGLQTPFLQSGDDDTWAPAGLTYADGALYFSGLRGQSIYAVRPGESAELTQHLSGRYGRLRSIITRGESLIVSTSNTDGRGQSRPDDDKLIEIPINSLY